jgi:glutathione-independent formaldehyde dehydrogenase
VKRVILRAGHPMVEEVSDPKLEEPGAAIVRVTLAGICPGDVSGDESPDGHPSDVPAGHQCIGVVEEAGAGVAVIRRGWRVAVAADWRCGHCPSCRSESGGPCVSFPRAEGTSAWAGHRAWGAQAEYVRVPYADVNCLPLPGEAGDSWEADFLLLADEMAPVWQALQRAALAPGASVAVAGSGSLAIMAVYAVRLAGAGSIYLIQDQGATRDWGERLGAITIDARAGDVAVQIADREQARGRPPERYPLPGTDVVVYAGDISGAGSWHLASLLNPGGLLIDLGVVRWGPSTAFQLVRTLRQKGARLSFAHGASHRSWTEVRDLLLATRTRPGRIVSHRHWLTDAAQAYQAAATGEDVLKAVLRP